MIAKAQPVGENTEIDSKNWYTTPENGGADRMKSG